MRNIFKRIVSSILVFNMFLSCVPVEVFAAGGGDFNTATPGGVGPYHTPAILLKAVFFQPSSKGLTSTNYKKKDGMDVEFTSLSNRAIFELAAGNNGTGVLPQVKPNKGEADSSTFGQFYALYPDRSPVIKLSECEVMVDKLTYAHTSRTGHYIVAGAAVTGTSNASYANTWGLLSFQNSIMNPLMAATDNGKNWDSTKVANAIQQIWTDYVDPATGNFSGGYTSNNVVRLRSDLASMFMTDTSVANIGSEFTSFLTNEIKVGMKPRGMSAPIQTEQQAANLQNLLVLSMALVLGNPLGGSTVSGHGTVDPSLTYKGSAYLNNLLKWAKSGGNSDSSDFHLALVYESYAVRRPSSGIPRLERWDLAFYGVTKNSRKDLFSTIPNYKNYDVTNTDWRNYCFEKDYVSSNANYFTKISAGGMLKANNSQGFSPTHDYNIADHYSSWTIFQNFGLNNNNVWSATKNYQSYNFRGIVEMRHPDIDKFAGEPKTINIGFNYFWPHAKNQALASSSVPPNFKQDDTIFAEEVEVGKGQTARATNYYSMMAAPPNTDVTNNTFLFNVPSSDWRNTNEEVNNLLSLIHRVSYNNGEQIANKGVAVPGAPGYTYDKLPVVITIKRSIENGKGNADGKILDNLYAGSTTIQQCGKHRFKVLSDNGVEAKIIFNIIPDSGSCSHDYLYRLNSPLVENKDIPVEIYNCFIAHLYEKAWSRIKFDDDKIQITDTPGGTTKVNYDFSYQVYKPQFRENLNAYGVASEDKTLAQTSYSGKGYSVVPEGYGQAYPQTDYINSGSTYVLSNTIRRSVIFRRAPETPYYTNLGYDLENPYYAEIKTNKAGNETFEAMAGTPTTRDLFMSTGATDFRVDFEAQGEEVTNGQTYRVYTYTVNINACPGAPDQCDSGCGSCLNPCPGHPNGDGGTSHCSSHTNHTVQHPINHTWVYKIKIPIEEFTYFDMTDSEVWRLTEWGLNGGEEFLEDANPEYKMNTKFWGLNVKDYSSGNGRIVFSANQNGNKEGSGASFGDNSTSATFSNGSHDANVKQALSWVNGQIAGESPVSGSVVSDYIILKTSEGYQVPYFYEQPFANSVKPSTAGKFDSEGGGTLETPDSLRVAKQLTINDFWWKNSNKINCASKENGWNNSSITYGGYNGQYNKVSEKYVNSKHKDFISKDNPLETLFKKYKVDINNFSDDHIQDGSGTVTFGTGTGNKEHIIEGLDVIDTTPNGEYDTGNMWLKYERVMLYDNNVKKNPSANIDGKFARTEKGTYIEDNIPYFNEAKKVNDIVIHDPVSAEYSIVITNDEQYDDRTNAELMQGGDPIGALGGVCPPIGCQYSTLTCTTPLTPHNDNCYVGVEGDTIHIGGNNSHVHDYKCYHKHTIDCYSGAMLWVHPSGCTFAGQTHVTTTTDKCSHCGHSCGSLKAGTGATENKEGNLNYTTGTGTDFYVFTAKNDGTVKFYSTSYGKDPRGRVYVNGVLKVDNDDGGSGYNFNTGEVAFKKGDTVRLNVYNYGSSAASYAYCVAEISYQATLICGLKENICTGELNAHKCTSACKRGVEKVLNCTDPHHYEPGEPTNSKDHKFHYAVGDPRCWTRCGDDSKHGNNTEVTLPDGERASMGGTFINLDREFKIYYPFEGDFAEKPGMLGIAETTDVRGKGYTNKMNTREWTDHRWVRFPVNVIDPKGNMRLAGEQIDLNEFSETQEIFEFYCVLANNEQAAAETKFTSTAINAPVNDRDTYFDESDGETNKERIDQIYAARHTAHKYQYIDVVGYIGALAINDTGDYRFSNLFKQAKGDGTWLIPNLVPEVHLNRPNFLVTDNVTSRRDDMSKQTRWLDTYGLMYNVEGGKSGGKDNVKEPLLMPLVPKYNNIEPLRNQPMRPGYQLYMDVETTGNYYGETMSEELQWVDNQMMDKMQIRPLYFSLDLKTGKYTPVNVYYGVNNEYMKVYDYGFDSTNDDVGVLDFYYYLDWLNESARRNFTNAESTATNNALRKKDTESSSDIPGHRQPTAERDIIGSSNVLFLNDLNRTFIGSEYTYGEFKNPGNLIPVEAYNEQSQRWHFTLGLPSSSVFVEYGKPCTEANIKALQSKDRVIICALDIKVQGEVWTLQYDGTKVNNLGFQVYEGGKTYDPPRFDANGKPTTDPAKDVTSNCPIVVVYDSTKTSEDDVISSGTH